MSEKKINIENFKQELAENYFLVKIIWDDICKNEFYVQPSEKLQKNDFPIDQCTDLEKILLACISFTENEQEIIMLTQVLLVTMYKNHNIAEKSSIKIKGAFFIIIE
ncbi:MAG: hypothetical protein WCL02_09210 [bacterium]